VSGIAKLPLVAFATAVGRDAAVGGAEALIVLHHLKLSAALLALGKAGGGEQMVKPIKQPSCCCPLGCLEDGPQIAGVLAVDTEEHW